MSEEFMGDQPSNQPEADQQKAQSGEKSEYSEFLQAIVNEEGKPKYKTVAEALMGNAHAQEHIRRLERENADLRGLETKVKTMEELLQRLEGGKQADQPRSSVEDVERLVESQLEASLRRRAEQENRRKVLDSIRGKYGDKAEEIMKARATELGLTLSDLGNLAAKSPNSVLAYFSDSKSSSQTVQSSVNTQAISPERKGAELPKNIMQGASTKDVVAYMRSLREEILQGQA